KGVVYTLPKAQDPSQIGAHTIILRRLCCPAMPPDPNPGSPTYNPYVTVDYLDGVSVNNGVKALTSGPNPNLVPTQKRSSVGRSQPYAATPSQLLPQNPLYIPQPPATPTSPYVLGNQPQHTFFGVNVQVLDPNTNQEATNPPNTPPPPNPPPGQGYLGFS